MCKLKLRNISQSVLDAQVVDRNTPWEGGLVAVNSFGFGGANAHVIFESEAGGGAKRARAAYAVPRVVLGSGRTEEAARALTTLAAQHRDDAGLHALLDAVHRYNIPGHSHRAFAVLTDTPMEECAVSPDEIHYQFFLACLSV